MTALRIMLFVFGVWGAAPFFYDALQAREQGRHGAALGYSLRGSVFVFLVAIALLGFGSNR